MLRLVLLGGVVVLLAGPIRALLARARWTEQAPRAGIALWQSLVAAIGLTVVAAVVETITLPSHLDAPRRIVTDASPRSFVTLPPGGASPESLFLLTAVLIAAAVLLGALALRAVGLSHERAQRRLLIDLVSNQRDDLPGVRVLPHEAATAFSLAGVRPRVVVSDGAIELLARDELDAVVAHERAHVRARHDLVLLPFSVLAQTLPKSRSLVTMRDRVGLLVELAADDRVVRAGESDALARALCRITTSAPTVLREAPGDDAPRRAARALGPVHRSSALAGASMLASAALLVMPMAVLLSPLGGR